jgi:hypothetical protein
MGFTHRRPRPETDPPPPRTGGGIPDKPVTISKQVLSEVSMVSYPFGSQPFIIRKQPLPEGYEPPAQCMDEDELSEAIERLKDE